MFFIFFGLWLLFNGRWSTEIAIVGAVISLLLCLFVYKFMDYSPKREWAVLRRVPKLMAYLGVLVKEIVASASATIRFIWSPTTTVEPEVTSFTTRLKTGWGKTLLANSITLTPGTITVDVQDDLFLVHSLDVDLALTENGGVMEDALIHVEGDK